MYRIELVTGNRYYPKDFFLELDHSVTLWSLTSSPSFTDVLYFCWTCSQIKKLDIEKKQAFGELCDVHHITGIPLAPDIECQGCLCYYGWSLWMTASRSLYLTVSNFSNYNFDVFLVQRWMPKQRWWYWRELLPVQHWELVYTWERYGGNLLTGVTILCSR